MQHSLGVFQFSLGRGGSRGVTLLWNVICYDLRVFQNFQDKPNFSGVFKKAFPQPPCLFFFQKRALIDRQTLLFQVLRYIHCPYTALAQNFFLDFPKIKFVTYYVQNIRLSLVSQQCARLQSENLYFNEIRVTYTFFYILKEADRMSFQASADKFCYVPTILSYIL